MCSKQHEMRRDRARPDPASKSASLLLPIRQALIFSFAAIKAFYCAQPLRVGVEPIYIPSSTGLKNAGEQTFPRLKRAEVLPRSSTINESIPPLRGRPRQK